MPIVSVIMPTYNVEEYFPQCIESVMNQDFKDIEIIPVDDGSPDSCGKIMDRYALQDSRVKPIHQANGGYGKAINTGLSVAKGKYIAIVETDDYVEPNMLSSLVHTAELKKCNVVKAGFKKIYQNGCTETIIPPLNFYKPIVSVNPMYSDDIMVAESSIWAALYSREFLNDNKIRMLETKGAAYQDVVWKFMVYSKISELVCIPDIVYCYRVMTPNSSSKSAKNWEAFINNYEIIKKWLQENNIFQNFMESYYLHFYFDSYFHYFRIHESYRQQLIEAIRKKYQEGLSLGIGFQNGRFSNDFIRSYYEKSIIPFFLEKVIRTSVQEEKKGKHFLLKKTALAFYHMKLGQRVWHKVELFLRRPKVANKVLRSICGNTLITNNDNMQEKETQICCYSLPFPYTRFNLDPVDTSKRILVVIPWYQDDAVKHNVENIVSSFYRNGFILHLFIYSRDTTIPSNVSHLWSKVFLGKSSNPYFSCTNGTLQRPDGDHIDEWVDDTFISNIVGLNEHYHYSAVFINYLFFSKAFEMLPSSCVKILCTHDVYYHRNTNLLKAGEKPQHFWFSLSSKEEEADALKRADYILAVQENDKAYFSEITKNSVPVFTTPFVPKSIFLQPKEYKNEDAQLTIGYLASSNPPNFYAIKKIMEGIKGNNNIHLYIGGLISSCFTAEDKQNNVTIIGSIENLRIFYSSYNVYINPDTFYSGFKCKTIEILSFGCPLVCTKVASTGIRTREKYHQLASEKECVSFLLELAKNDTNTIKDRLQCMSVESQKVYKEFEQQYSIEEIMQPIIRKSNEIFEKK